MNLDRKMLYFIYKPLQPFICKTFSKAYKPILQAALEYKPRGFLLGTCGN